MKNNFLKIFGLIGFLVLLGAGGFYWNQLSGDGEKSLRVGRGLAGVGLEVVPIEITYSVDDLHIREMKIRLIQASHREVVGQTPSFALGAFRFQDSFGVTQDICEIFDTVEIQLRAEGVAVSGDSPKIWIKGPCQFEEGNSAIDPFPVPLKEVARRGDSDQELVIGAWSVSQLLLVDEFPETWSLDEVKLRNSETSEFLALSRYEVIFANENEPVTFLLSQ